MKPNIVNDASNLYRKQGKESLTKFVKLYLSQHVTINPSKAHLQVHAKLQEITHERGKKIAIAAPREFGKSTMVTLGYILYAICYGTEKFIVIISNTASQACAILENVRRELSENPLLKRDFPEIFESDGRPKLPRWRQNDIITRNGIEVLALGYGQQIRGRKNKADRPTAIFLDDLESGENQYSIEAKEKMMRWLNGSVLKAGSEKTNFVFIGTVHHSLSILGDYLKKDFDPDWQHMKFKAIEEWPRHMDLWGKYQSIRCRHDNYGSDSGPEVALQYYADHQAQMHEGAVLLWPEKWDLRRLMERYGENDWSFMSEMQNEPVDADSKSFNVDGFQYWTDEYPTIDALLKGLGDGVQIFGACDPALAQSGPSGDYSSLVILARKGKDYYVLVAEISHTNPDQLNRDILAYAKRYHFTKFVVESNGFQSLMLESLQKNAREQNLFFSIEKLTNTGSKKDRIYGLYEWLKSGDVKFARSQKMLLDQFRIFPNGKHDDGPDTLEMVMRIATQYNGMNEAVVKAAFDALKAPSRDFPYFGKPGDKRIIGYGDKPYDDFFGLMSGVVR